MNKATALASTSQVAISRTAPQPAIKPVDRFVSLSIAYNAFDMADLEHHELEFRPGATINDYLEGLPAECEWGVFLNGKEIEPSEEGHRKIAAFDHIGLVLIPQGGKGGLKKILMAVAAVAMVVVGAITGQTWLIMAGIGMGLSLISNMLLAPKQPKSGTDDN